MTGCRSSVGASRSYERRAHCACPPNSEQATGSQTLRQLSWVAAKPSNDHSTDIWWVYSYTSVMPPVDCCNSSAAGDELLFRFYFDVLTFYCNFRGFCLWQHFFHRCCCCWCCHKIIAHTITRVSVHGTSTTAATVASTRPMWAGEGKRVCALVSGHWNEGGAMGNREILWPFAGCLWSNNYTYIVTYVSWFLRYCCWFSSSKHFAATHNEMKNLACRQILERFRFSLVNVANVHL